MEKKTVDQIIITRTGDNEGKTVIEIDGENIKVNGKDVKDAKDVSVHRNKLNSNSTRVLSRVQNGDFDFDFDWDDHGVSLFTEDENRAMLGVVTEENDKGAEIKSVTAKSGAEKAGLKKGDVITKIGDKKIVETEDVTKAIRANKPGAKVQITFLRDGKEQNATAELGKWQGIKMNAVTMPRMDPGQWQMSPPEPLRAYGFGGRPRLGMSIQDTDDGKGVKVLDVDDDANAAKAGIKKGDIITAIDDKDVNSADEITKIVRGDVKDKTSWKFKVLRDGKSQNIEVRVPRRIKTADL
jgi:serine protease Do